MAPFLRKTVLALLAVLVILAAMPMTAFAANDAGQIVVACVGDSITQGIGSTSPTTNSYPAKLQSELGDRYQVVNCGMSGSTLMVENGAPYYRKFDPYQLSLTCKPDIVIIMLGTNDSKPQYWAYKDHFVDQLIHLAREYQEMETKPTVYIATSAYVSIDLDGITDAVVTNEVVPLQKNAARRARCEVIDINAFTQGHDDWYCDGVHPSNDGYAKMADYVADFISKRHDAPIVKDLVERLDKLPKKITEKDITQAETLLFLFERLTDRQQKLVTKAQWDKVDALKKAVDNLQNPTTSSTTKKETTRKTTASTTRLTTTKVPQSTQTAAPTKTTKTTKPIETTQPTKVTQAIDTTQSVDTTQPTVTTQSEDTTQSTEMTQPTDATQPSESTQPSEPTQPTNITQPDEQKDVSTDDDLLLWIVIPVAVVLIGGAVFGLIVWKNKKKTNS